MPQADLVAHVGAVLRRRLQGGERLVLGLSGGVDSVVLLHALLQVRKLLNFKLSAVHVNHRISPNADRWAQFCRELCDTAGIPVEVVAVDVRRQPGESLEAAAREARYRAFGNLPADYLVLAHHLDDQAETLLLQLLRGAGVKGLSGMPESRSGPAFSATRILRPLLEIPRRRIESYAAAHGLSWIEDESNVNIAFDRNYLRHQVLPALELRFPHYRKTLLRASRNLAEAAHLMDDLARIDAGHAIVGGRLSVAALHRLSWERGKNLLRYHLSQQGLPIPGAQRLSEILRQLLHAGADAAVHASLGEYDIRRFSDQVWLCKQAQAPNPDLSWQWQGQPELPLPELQGVLRFVVSDGRGLSLVKLRRAPVTVRLRQGGERLRPDCARPDRSLKNLLQECRMPPWQRDLLPLLYSGDDLVFVPGVGAACTFQAIPGEAGVEVHWCPEQ